MKDSLRDYEQLQRDRFFKSRRQVQPDQSQEELLGHAQGFAATLIKNIEGHYSQYRWVASVSIPLCHKAVSQSRAEKAVDAALDVLRLFVIGRPDLYRRANSPNIPFVTRGIVTDSQGKIGSVFRKVAHGAPAGENWYSDVREHAGRLWSLFEQSLECSPGQGNTDQLNQRLLDAVNWFGQAIVEQNPAGKIVKYTAALERLTMTGHIPAGNIEKLITARILMLNQDRKDKIREQIEDDIGKLYECRSNLMHGSVSPFDPTVARTVRIAWEIARWSILNAALIFDLLRRNGKTGRKDLAKLYDGGRRDAREPD